MKVAIASSGLGHISRGIETWACDTAVALAELSVNSGQWAVGSRQMTVAQRADVSSVTLFCAAPIPPAHCSLRTAILPCLKRGDWLARIIAAWAPAWTWRWGWKSAYDIEQRSFWRHLWPILRDERYDILHVQDPLLADLCRRYRKAGKLKTKEILAHGTEESPEFLAPFDYVQHLAPWHLEQAVQKLGEKRV